MIAAGPRQKAGRRLSAQRRGQPGATETVAPAKPGSRPEPDPRRREEVREHEDHDHRLRRAAASSRRRSRRSRSASPSRRRPRSPGSTSTASTMPRSSAARRVLRHPPPGPRRHHDHRPAAQDGGPGRPYYVVLRMLSCEKGTDEVQSDQVSLIVGPNFVISFQESTSRSDCLRPRARPDPHAARGASASSGRITSPTRSSTRSSTTISSSSRSSASGSRPSRKSWSPSPVRKTAPRDPRPEAGDDLPAQIGLAAARGHQRARADGVAADQEDDGHLPPRRLRPHHPGHRHDRDLSATCCPACSTSTFRASATG